MTESHLSVFLRNDFFKLIQDIPQLVFVFLHSLHQADSFEMFGNEYWQQGMVEIVEMDETYQ